MDLGTALIYAITGIAVVFAVLFLLFLVIRLFGKSAELLAATKAKRTVEAPASPAEEEKKACCEAPGNVKLIKVDDKTAAMLMAIVADSLNVAPERLHFEYIKLLED